jgi:glucose-1-phosphate adenylyltransferase
VIILSGDHVYKMDYAKFLAYHRMKKAGLTISGIRTPKEQAAKRLGVLEVDREYRVIGFEEKPAQPKVMPEAPEYALASMGIYIFNLKTLFRVMKGDQMDFGKHVIPGMINERKDVFVYDFEKENQITDYEIRVKDGVREKVLIECTRDSSYWKDVGTIDSFYEASMDLVNIDPQYSLYGEKWPLRTYQRQLPPSKCIIGGKILDSIVSDGCIISGGTIDHSILSPGVIIERDAFVQQSVIFDESFVEPGARIRRAIIDKECKIRAGASIGYNFEADKSRGCTVTDSGIVVVPKGTEITRNEPTLM